MRLFLDFETASELDLPKAGVSRYARHPSTRALMLAYALNGGPVRQWVPAEFEPMPEDLLRRLRDPRVVKSAWNVSFEYNIFRHVLGLEIPIVQWRDTMVTAMALSLPGPLAACGKVMKLDPDLIKTDGMKYIKRFSTLKHRWMESGQEEHWEAFKSYNRQDVEAERAIWRKLRRYDMTEAEWDLFALDQEVNEKGLPVNLDVCRGAVKVRNALVRDYLQEMQERTGLRNPNSRDQLLGWLMRYGYPYSDLRAGHVRQALEAGGLSYDVSRVLELRLQVSKISSKKFDAILRHADSDAHLRYTIQFAGAGRTGRWAGRVVQPHNLPRPLRGLDGLDWGKTPAGNPVITGGQQIDLARLFETGDVSRVVDVVEDPMGAMAGATRTAIQAPPGHVFIVFDFAAIENVVLGWLSGDRKILEVFEKGLDPYLAFATELYGQSYASLLREAKAGNKVKRTIAKPAVLGCGYMLGPGEERETDDGEIESTGLLGYAQNMGVTLTPEQSEKSVATWRARHHVTVDYWYELERAAFRAVRHKQVFHARGIRFDYQRPFLRMRLPNGRLLHYLRPRIESRPKPWGTWKPTLVYEGFTVNRKWGVVETHPGKLMENADQATARDILAHGLTRLRHEGLDVRLHVHDEAVALVPERRVDEAFETMRACMTMRESWYADMPVSAEGFVTRWYVKT